MTWCVGDFEDEDLLLHQSGLDGAGGYELSFTRQFSFSSNDEHRGMNALVLTFDEFPGLPPDRVPNAQRWGYAGPHRPDVSDETHAEIGNWAGHVSTWVPAVEASNSLRVMSSLPPGQFVIQQNDI